MMIRFPQLQWLHGLKRLLMICMTLSAVLSLGLAIHLSVQNAEKILNWSEYPGQVIAVTLAEEGLVEIEAPIELADSLPKKIVPESCYPHWNGNTCLILPRSAYAWLEVFDEIGVLQNPEEPGEIEIATYSGLWFPVVSYFLATMMLLGLRKWLKLSGIGEDRTRERGGWVPTESSLEPVCKFGVEPHVIRETTSSDKGVLFWSVIFALIAVCGISAAIFEADANPFKILLITVIVCGILGVALFTSIETRTRAVYQDQKGFLDSHFFGVKRVPWSEVASLELVNLNREAQERYDRTSFTRRKGGRPTSLNVYVVRDGKGRDIVRFSEKMMPMPSFNAFLIRLRRATKPVWPDSMTERKQDDKIAVREEKIDRLYFVKQAPLRDRHELERSVRSIGLMAMLITLTPFVLITLFLCYKSLWFQYAAERTEGRIVEINVESLPSLVVEYSTAKTGPLHIESDGAEANRAYQVGDELTVFYDPADPNNAKLDLFLELWLGTITATGFTIAIFLLVVLIRRNFASAKSLH
ncbi:MAG: hypothetical protein CVV06_07005 [Gammaproteobacteria bacterium HGW-Gammaproteobacteria-10]|nr:MAG: hypothetical protein CVV06_07005 [Gammaproteobacteria bacterium HGW-Gammaproteobacteria-10]